MEKKYFFLIFFILIFSFSFSQTTEKMKEVRLYPNPAQTFFSVDGQGVKIEKIEIFSLLGVKEREIVSRFKYIRIDDLPRGIYMIKIYSKEGYVVKKLIKNSSE